jgi:uncharacterized protein YggT (Ycf19 family)
MTEDAKLAIDETNRAAQYEAVKGEVRKEVRDEIAREGQGRDDAERSRAARIGDHLRQNAVDEIARTEAEIRQGRAAARVSQVVDYAFWTAYSLIGLKIILELFGAREGNLFKEAIDALASPLLFPFDRLIPDLSAGRFELKLSYIFALVVYSLVHLGVNGILRMMAHRKTAI